MILHRSHSWARTRSLFVFGLFVSFLLPNLSLAAIRPFLSGVNLHAAGIGKPDGAMILGGGGIFSAGDPASPTFSPAAGTYPSTQSVQILDAAPGTVIYYTTNGTAPSTSSTIYIGPITVPGAMRIRAIAAVPGGSTSQVAAASYTISPAATPTFTPAAGSYQTTQSVRITDASPGAAIYYTTNGQTATTSSTLYTGPISAPNTLTLSAIAVVPNSPTSLVGAATYTITAAAVPTFSPAEGTYASTQSVLVSSATPGAAIYYTTNGLAPSTSSTLYSGPITVSGTTRIRALAVYTGGPLSQISAASYTITPAATPAFSPAAGSYGTTQSVRITDASSGAAIYYTTNGQPPTAASTLYTGPIAVTGSETLRAIAVAPNTPVSAAAAASYTITVAATPTFSPAAGTYASTQSVSISSSTSGAAIYYTTNGTAPTTSSALYATPLSVTGSTMRIRALAVYPGGPLSEIAVASYTITPAATPTFNPAAGSYQATQSVRITAATPGSSIYYTTNGQLPTTASALYSGPISVTGNTTLSAIAVTSTTPASPVAAATYTITAAAAPTFSPAAGTYASTQSVHIASTTSGAAIYYTTNGTAPSTSSTLYTGPVAATGTTRIRALAVYPGGPPSQISAASYTITPAATPTFTPAGGSYQATQTVHITTATPGAAIYYTTNGQQPTAASTLYTGPISVTGNTTLSAIAVTSTTPASQVAAATYTITAAATPTFSPAAGTYTSTQSVQIVDATSGAAIYYTTNGLAPTTSSTQYTGPITVATTARIRALAVYPGGPQSQIAAASYTITPTATPTFTPAPGSYQSTQSVHIVDATSGAAIYYTTNGLTPTASSTLYTGPISVSSTTTLSAIALAPNAPNSSPAGAIYTITAAAVPTFSPAAGTYTTNQSVQIVDSTPGVTIYYTTNGLAPTTSSTVYTGPIAVTGTTRIRAIAVYPDGPQSQVAAASYTITPAAAPSFSPPAGTYQSTQSVLITAPGPGAAIYYTTNGQPPTTASTLYSGPITVSSNESLSAIAVVPNTPASAVAAASYTIAPAATPTFVPAAGAYTGTQSVQIVDATPGAAIYYTTNGFAPTTTSTPYTGPISVTSTMRIRALAIYPGGPLSQIAAAAYTITPSAKPVQGPNTSATFLGLDINHLLLGTPWPTFTIDTIRLWDSYTRWSDLNPQPGTYNWTNLDQTLSFAQTNGADVLYTFGGVPSWAIPTNIPIQSVTRTSGIVTVTTTEPHALYYSSIQNATSQPQISVSGVTDTSFDGTFYITGTPTADTVTYAQAAPDGSSQAGTISAVCGGPDVPTACAEAPQNMSDWDNYVTQLISHVGPGVIKYWEVWNEVNESDFWRGDPMTLVTMAQHAQSIIKAVDPNAIILSPSVTHNYPSETNCQTHSFCGSDYLNNWLNLGGKTTIDAIAFHGYPSLSETPEEIVGAVNVLEAVATSNGLGALPLWDTESSWGEDVVLPDGGDEVAWLARHLLLEQSVGVQRSFWYAYDNLAWGSLWTQGSGLTPAGTAYEQIATWLTDVSLTQPCAPVTGNLTTYTCSFTRSNGYMSQVVWSTTGPATYTVPQGFVQFRDLTGNVTPIGGGTVQISAQPILLENQNPQ